MLDDFLEGYAVALAPLVVPMLLVPVRDTRGLHPLLLEVHRATGLQAKTLDKHFTFSEKALKEGRWWTALTYMFHHQDVRHLTGNLFSLCWMSRPVYSRFGSVGLYSIFLSGGVLAAIDLQSKNWQLSESVGSLIKNVNPFPQAWGISTWFDTATRGVSQWLAPYIAPYIYYKGGSAGVFALMGASACAKIEDLISITRKPGEYDFASKLLLGLDISYLVMAFTDEYKAAASGKQLGVDHAGHVDGFVVGVIAYAVLSVGQLAWREYRRRNFQGRGRTVGRR